MLTKLSKAGEPTVPRRLSSSQSPTWSRYPHRNQGIGCAKVIDRGNTSARVAMALNCCSANAALQKSTSEAPHTVKAYLTQPLSHDATMTTSFSGIYGYLPTGCRHVLALQCSPRTFFCFPQSGNKCYVTCVRRPKLDLVRCLYILWHQFIRLPCLVVIHTVSFAASIAILFFHILNDSLIYAMLL